MAIEVFNRHECKFLIDDSIYERIQKRLLQYMEPDEYNRTNELYTISNIYYDTADSYLIRNSLSKPIYKEKLRIRAYGVPKSDAKVYLEIKKKVCGLVNKRRTKLKLNEAYDFVVSGKKPELKDYMNRQVMNEIEYILRTYDLEPKLYLAYDRNAMFGKDNRDLRITFDTNVRTRRHDLKLESGDYGKTLIGNNKWIMEVKAEKNIPLWLSKLLSEFKIYKTTYSKYGKEYEKYLIDHRNLEGDVNLCLKPYSTQQLQLAQQYL